MAVEPENTQDELIVVDPENKQDELMEKEDITNTKIYKIRKYIFNFTSTVINIILFYYLFKYVIYPIFYTINY